MVVASFLLFVLAAVPQSVVLPAGTQVVAKLESEVSSGRSRVGDSVTAVIDTPLRASSGIVIPRGSHLSGRVETIQAATQSDGGRVRLVFREIELPDGRQVSTWITNAFEASAPRRTLRYFLFMATGGAAGGFVGGNSARVAGALGGMLIGFVLAGSGDDSKLPNLTLHAGTILHLQLGEDFSLPSR